MEACSDEDIDLDITNRTDRADHQSNNQSGGSSTGLLRKRRAMETAQGGHYKKTKDDREATKPL